jgi:hypothetical protein
MRIGTRWSRWVWIIVVAILLVWGFTDVRRRADLDPHNIRAHRTDFTIYTEAGAAFFVGRDPYTVTNHRGWHYLYPPLFALLVAPLHALTTSWQGVTWFLLSLLMAAGCLSEFRKIAQRIQKAFEGRHPADHRNRHHCLQGHGLILPLPRPAFDLLHCPQSFSCDAPAPRQLSRILKKSANGVLNTREA